MSEDNCVLSEEEIACIQVTFEEKFVTHGELFTDKLDKILLKITKLNDMAKEKKETEKIGLLGKDADAIVFSEYSIGKEFKEKGK